MLVRRVLTLSMVVACADARAPARREAPAPVRDAGAAPGVDAAPRRAPQPDPAPFDRVLAAFVRDGRFDYAGLKADAARTADLERFLASVAQAPSPDLATLLSAYDAIVIGQIVARHPIRSVMDVPGFFDRIRHRVGGRDVTLNQLEKEWILPTFRDPRVHFALNCGARSCPPLPTTAFRAASLDRTLDEMTRAALAREDFVAVGAGGVRVTSLFDWYAADFEGGALAFLRRYRPDVPVDARLRFLTYDWRLNDAP